MNTVMSISTHRRYGVARVCRVWGFCPGGPVSEPARGCRSLEANGVHLAELTREKAEEPVERFPARRADPDADRLGHSRWFERPASGRRGDLRGFLLAYTNISVHNAIGIAGT
jgi:hypothetical protein